jgi:hypothetical protein
VLSSQILEFSSFAVGVCVGWLLAFVFIGIVWYL